MTILRRLLEWIKGMTRKHPIEGRWLLRSREGQDAPSYAVRFFCRHTYQWIDFGRDKITQEGRYTVDGYTKTAVGSYEILCTRPDSDPAETYRISIADDELTIQRQKPTVGQLTVYYRLP